MAALEGALQKGRWGDEEEEESKAPPVVGGASSGVDAVAASLASQSVSAVETMKTAEGETIQVERASGDTSELVAARSWEDLNLEPSLLKGVYLANFAKPFKIQEAALRDLGVPSCRDAIDATRVHRTMPWVVSFLRKRPFGPRCSAQATHLGRLQEDAGAREFIGAGQVG